MLKLRKFTDRDIVIFGRFMTSYGYYLVIPFLAVYLTQYADVSIVQAGLLLAIFNFSRRGLGLFAGYLSDYFGSKAVMLAGIVCEMIAYLAYTVKGDFVFLILVVTLSGAGGCLYNIGSRTILAGEQKKGNIAESFSLYYIIMHIGAVLGPISYIWLSGSGNMRVTFLIAAASYLVFFIVSCLAFKDQKRHAETSIRWRDVGHALANKQFLTYCIILTFVWIIVTQLYCTIPLMTVYKGLPESTVANLNLINAFIVIFLLFPLGKHLDKLISLKKLELLILGTLTMSLGWLLCAVPAHGSWSIFAAVVVYTLGEIMFISVGDVLANTFAPEGQSGIYLGLSAVTWGIGGSVGSYLGGIGFNYFKSFNIGLFWIIVALLGFVTCLVALFVRTRLFENESGLKDTSVEKARITNMG